MRVTEVPARDARPLITEVHTGLLALLASLRDTEWAAHTEAGHWSVTEVALHLLDGDLVQLSIGQDGDRSGLLDDTCQYRQFVRTRREEPANGWELDEGTAPNPAAALRLAPRLAWRQLTGLPVPAGEYTTEGDERLAAPPLSVRGIIV